MNKLLGHIKHIQTWQAYRPQQFTSNLVQLCNCNWSVYHSSVGHRTFQSRALTAAHEYFQHVRCHWNNSRTPSAAEIVLFQFQTWLHVKQNTEMISKQLYFTCNHGITDVVLTKALMPHKHQVEKWTKSKLNKYTTLPTPQSIHRHDKFVACNY